MLENKWIGWLSVGSLALAVGILALLAALLVFAPTAPINAQVAILVSGGLALLAALLGFAARRTPHGKVGGIGGLALFGVIAVFLSFTLVAFVEVTGGAAAVGVF